MIRSRPRRRRRYGLSRPEHHYLRWGRTPFLDPDTAIGFLLRDGAGAYHVDEAEARRVWNANLDTLLAEARTDGCIPWAARHFDGMPGRVSVYDHLRDPRDPDHWPRPH